MKAFLVFLVVSISGNLMAQSSPMESSSGNRHMFEFNSDSVIQSVFSISKSKTKGSSPDNDTNFNLSLNYAYSLPKMPKVQVGSRLTYFKQDAVAGRGDAEDYGLEIGGIYNMKEDLQDSPYVSLYLGFGWANTYGGRATNVKRRDELLTSTLAVGKRMALERFGIKHLTYTPEIALENQNSTTGGSIEYRQDIQFRVLQFSVFF